MLGKVAILLGLVAASAACDAACQWAKWKVQYGKVYTAKEEEYRFGVFKNKLAEIEKLSAEQPLARFGPNKWSDLTREEFKSKMAYQPEKDRRGTPTANVELGKRSLPTTYVSPYVTVAQNQGQCGSCWAFATMGVLEGQYKRLTGSDVVLSPQQLVDCATGASGCNGGFYDSALSYLISATTSGGGANYMSDYAYKGTAGTCSANTKSVVPVKSQSSYTMDETVGSGISSTLYTYGPVGIALDATTLESYSSGILTASTSCSSGVDHAVLLAGWGVSGTTNYWIVKNSWGSDWGETSAGAAVSSGATNGGFFRIARGACLISSYSGYIGFLPDTVAGSTTPATAVASSSSGIATPVDTSSQASCTPSSSCGTAVCGSVSNGCGGTVSCGTCSSTQTCSSGSCVSSSTSTAWTLVSGSGITASTSSGSTVLTAVASTSESKMQWTGSSGSFAKAWTSVQATVKATSAGTYGIGAYYGQGSGRTGDGIAYKAVVASGGTFVYNFCYTYYGTETCTAVTPSTTSFALGTAHNFTVVFANDGSAVSATPTMDGKTLTTVYSLPASAYTTLGNVYVTAKTGAATFTAPKMVTRSTVLLGTTACHTEEAWKAQVGLLLHVPAAFYQVTGTTACTANGTTFSKFRIDITDANETRYLTAAVHGLGITNYQSSANLARDLVAVLKTGHTAFTGYEVASVSLAPGVVDSAAIPLSVAASAAGGLSSGAVAGIAVGASVGGLLLAGAAGFAVYAATRPAVSEPIPDDFQPHNPMRKTFFRIKKSRGVDVINPTPGHQSITGRAPPMA